MSFFDCVQDAIDEGSADRERGRRAQEMWKEISDRYERQGASRANAEAMAAEDVKMAFKKEAGEMRHVFLAKLASNRKLQTQVANTDQLPRHQTRSIEKLDYRARGLVRRFNARLGTFLREHSRDILGNVRNPAQMRNIVRELYGESTGDAAAMALSKGIRESLEEMRLMFNEAGGVIGKLDNYGLPQTHNRMAVIRAGMDSWIDEIQPRIDWKRIEDDLTGRPFQDEAGPPPDIESQRRFLTNVWENIAYGKGTREAVYGRPQGSALYRRRSQSRVLHFKSADDWIDYNKKFGTGDPLKSLMGHVQKMSRDIVAMREFGPNPMMGVEYQQQLAMQRARSDGISPLKVEGNGKTAVRMMRVEQGGVPAETLGQHYMSTFLSNARHLMTAAFLDRAVFASIADTNTMRLASQAIGMNPANTFKRHIGLMADGMKREEAMRAGWVADTLADPGVALARFQAEVPASEVFERISSASMRLQGLSGWTDTGRIAFQMETAGYIASFSGRKLSEVDEPLRNLLVRADITEEDWSRFTDPEFMFKAGNGATFASPAYWRASTDLPYDAAEDIYFKFQGLIEEQTEYAVPTQSLLARAYADPAAAGIPPGTILYEIAKSGLAFKSFTMTFTVNQLRRIAAIPTWEGRVGYGLNLAAGGTVMGAVALQLLEISKGNDPSAMTNPSFWGKAALKGGGFGIMGDIIATGQSSWGGGFASYVAGPGPQLLGDAWNLTIKNAYEFAIGEDTNIAAEIARAGKRYTPLGQTPVIGPAMDRLLWDQLQIYLDPESQQELLKRSQRTNNLNGTDSWWLPGSPLPGRSPDFSNALGQ